MSSVPANSTQPEPFTINVSEQDLEDLRQRLRSVRWPGDIANDTWHYGASESYLRELTSAWIDFDWRATEAKMNELDHFQVELGGQPIHYVRANAGAGMPILLLSGWPCTFWDFAEVLPKLSGFEVIIAELPGYGFSSPLRVPKLGFVAAADLMHELMTEVLGHDRYGVHGYDWGGFTAAQMAHKYAASITGFHTSMPMPLDFAPVPPGLWSPAEAGYAERTAQFWAHGAAYFNEHATKPQTVAFIGDSPVATAAWLVEKFQGWTDHGGNVEDAYPRDHILATLSIYWFTRTVGSSARFYAESMQNPWTPSHGGTPTITVPTGIAAFPKEAAQVPKAWVEQYFNLQRYTRMDRGGHFPAVENPAGLADELIAFFTGL